MSRHSPNNPAPEVLILKVNGIEDLNTEQIKDILSSTVIDAESQFPIQEEIDEILSRIISTNEGDPTYVYYIAVARNAIRGVMGMRKVGDHEDPMHTFVGEQPAVEIINAFVDPRAPPMGIGSQLHSALLNSAIMGGAKVAVVNSGPRYRQTGWPFWNKLYGEPIGVVKNLYGSSLDAPVWVRYLSNDIQVQ